MNLSYEFLNKPPSKIAMTLHPQQCVNQPQTAPKQILFLSILQTNPNNSQAQTTVSLRSCEYSKNNESLNDKIHYITMILYLNYKKK